MESNSELEQGLKGQCKRLCLQKEGDQNGMEQVDRISNLPDHVIGDMLSFLKTDEAVRTSILSSSWRYLWKGITRLYLCYSGSPIHKFEKFVDHILLNCASMKFEVLILSCPRFIDLPRLSGWICRAQECNIKELTLCVNMPQMELPGWALPRCILTCTTLVALDLRSYFDIEVPDRVSCFPHLKSIQLHFIFRDHHDAVHRLLSCCPVLEELQLHGYLDSPMILTFHISVPTLRRFTLWIKDDEPAAINDNNIIINTPNLEYLSIFDNSFCSYVLENLNRVQNVDIGYEAICLGDLLLEHINRLFELFKGIGETKLLILHTYTLEVLKSAPSCTWPSFQFLVNLILRPSSISAWTCLNALHIAPNLEVLILDLVEMSYVGNQYIPPVTVPNCLVQCLKRIGIRCFLANKDGLQAVEYLLNNAQVLELMVIGFLPIDKVVVEKLLAFPKASTTCNVDICEDFWYETELAISQSNSTI